MIALSVLVLNGLGIYYGLDAWSPFRLIPNLLVVAYAIYRIKEN